MDGYHYSPQTIASLTPAQIRKLCLHPRNKDGTIRLPYQPKDPSRMPYVAPPEDLDEALGRLESYYKAMRLPESQLQAAKTKLRENWGKPRGNSHGQRSRRRGGGEQPGG